MSNLRVLGDTVGDGNLKEEMIKLKTGAHGLI